MLRRLSVRRVRPLSATPTSPTTVLRPCYSSLACSPSRRRLSMASNSTALPAASSADEPVISIHRGGQLVEQGTHSQLLQRNGLYSQLTKQAAAPLHAPPEPANSQKLLWLDLEMTGLDESVHCILEVAVIVTDMQLQPLVRYHATVRQPAEALAPMSDYVRQMHTKSGLLERLASGKAESQVEAELCALIDQHFGAVGGKGVKVLLAGNTVHMDRRFIRRYWPEVERRLFYRIVDVSSFKEVFANLWGVWWAKRNAHEAVSDVEESIAELAYYLRFVTVTPDKLQQPTATS